MNYVMNVFSEKKCSVVMSSMKERTFYGLSYYCLYCKKKNQLKD